MWFLLENIVSEIQSAYSAGLFDAQGQLDFEARSLSSSSSNGPSLLSIAGDQAEIKIEGVLTKKPDFMAYLFGGGNTTYSDIISALAMVDSDSDVKEVTLLFDSGGGSVDGMFETIAAIQSFSKPIKAVVGGTLASAAYALASATDRIEASSRASQIGSIGVATSMRVSDDVVTLTSTEAPNKRPDVRTEEGKNAVIEALDEVHELFAETIADGRGTTVDKVNSDYGRGAVMLADKALTRGMIDAVAGPSLKTVPSHPKLTTANAGGESKEAVMDLKELETKHPDVFAAAVSIGTSKERDRVCAHITMGKTSGALDTAITAVKEGTEMTETLRAEYFSAAMDRRDVEARDNDSEGTSDATASTDDNVNAEDRDTKLSADLTAQFFAEAGLEQVQ